MAKKQQSPSLRLYKATKKAYGKRAAKEFLSATILCLIDDLEESHQLNSKAFESFLKEEADWIEKALKYEARKRKKTA